MEPERNPLMLAMLAILFAFIALLMLTVHNAEPALPKCPAIAVPHERCAP